ncbi:MAG: coenzyme F420-0:L-glutamate ligase [Candidatus Hodarchaeales archaeon]
MIKLTERVEMHIEVFPLNNFPIINPGDDVAEIISEQLRKASLEDNDIIVIAHTIISKAENQVYDLSKVDASDFAKHIAKLQEKDPQKIEVILRESSEIVRMDDRVLITVTKHGFICANSGVDKSNTPGNTVISLPKDPDKSARDIRDMIKSKLGKEVAVIISDTFGRPFRVGTVNFAIGIAGMSPLIDFRGEKDLFGYELRSTVVARADEIAAAAGIVMGQADEGTPVILVRGVEFDPVEGNIKSILRDREFDVFR